MSEGRNQLSTIPQNIPAGAKAFQAAVDGVLTEDIWKEILDAQIKKAKEGDRGAAKFLLEYAGGVASMRGATFLQENHEHHHYSDAVQAPRLTDSAVSGRNGKSEPPDRTPNEYAEGRERRAREASNAVNGSRSRGGVQA